MGSEQSNKEKQYNESEQTPVIISDLVKATTDFCYVFKGDLYKDACLGVLENQLSVGGNILKAALSQGKKVSSVTDILSSSLLTQIQKPWTQPGFEWTHRTAKMALCQTAMKYKKRIADITLDDLAKNDITQMTADKVEMYKKYTLSDISDRITTVQRSFFP